ncbi:hypothetical protein [Pelagicoccus mobilis]|uniref:Uncharacterized protein n=1 Tax=Pelagicoccus mobilis TaxID=415221 RepID=A0A934VKV9_9BACT|nr:hypothetical protein [Pelagicoccus mobilis]MBK1877101.1 hypothetical protein [Pelagicoccus mobilis]
MQQEIDTTTPDPLPTEIPPQKLFTAKAIGVGAFIGGPLAATILLGRNFHTLGLKHRRNRTLLLGLGLTLSYFWLLFAIPDSILDSIPSAVFGALTAIIAYNLTEKFQGRILRDHFAKQGLKGSGWAVAGWSVLSLILTLGIAMLYVPTVPAFDFEEEVYTEGLLGNEIYYSDDIDTVTLKELGDYLIEIEYFDSEYWTPIQLIRRPNGYDLTVPYLRTEWEYEETAELFQEFAAGIETHVLNEPVSITLIDADFSEIYRKRLQ